MDLSGRLIELGFRLVLGVTEDHLGHPREVIRGERLTWDICRSVYCVYDDTGRPWITEDPQTDKKFYQEVTDLAREFGIKLGCYVPCSNDCGKQNRIRSHRAIMACA